ncbi:uncharacterized protein LOC144911804 isoform X2 [Branchiostoma floridae x Branchiostoma belcheri]
MYSSADQEDNNNKDAENAQTASVVRKSGNVQVLRTVVEERESRSTSSSVSSQATTEQRSQLTRTARSAVRSLKEKAQREVQVYSSVSRDSRAVRQSKSVKFHRKERRRRSFQGHPYEDLFNNLLATDGNDLRNARIKRRASVATGRPAAMEGRGRQSPASFSDRSSPSGGIIRAVLAQAAGKRLKKVQKKIERAKTPTLPDGDEHRYHSGISDYEEAERSLALSDKDGPASLRSLRAGTPPLYGSRPSSGRIPQIRRDTDEESGREGDDSVPRSAASTPRGENWVFGTRRRKHITGSVKELSVSFSKKSPQGSRALRIEKERLESELRKEKAELSNMRFEREMLLEREKQYGKNIQDLQNRVSQLLTQQDRLQKEHGTELGRFQSKALADVEREKKDAAQRARILEGELDALKVENASLEKQLRVAKTTSALARESDRTGRERHQSELRNMQDEIRRTHQLLAEQEKVVEENNKKSAQMHEKFAKAREQKTQLERDLENSKSVAEQRIKTLEGRAKVAEENLELARTEHSEELAKTREELISQVMQLQTKQSELTRLLTIEREKTKSLQSTVRHLEDRLERQRSSSRSSGFAGSEGSPRKAHDNDSQATESEREEIEESLRSQIEELQYQKDELEAQLDELREEFENKVFNETKELQKTFSEKVATLLKENEESHKKVKSLEDELTNSRTAAGLQSGENRKLLARLHEADSQINKLRENLEKSEAQLGVKEQEKLHVLHEKSQQQSEISRLRAKLTTQEALIQTAEDGRQKVENEWKKTMEDLKATDSVRIELERLKSQLKELDNEYQESCQERTDMAKKLEVSAKEADSLRVRVDSLLSDLEQLDSQKAGLLEEIGARDRKMESLLAQYRALEDQLQRDRRDLLSEQDLSQRLMGQLAELQQKYQLDAEARTGDFEEQNAKLLQDNYKLLNTIELKEAELEETSRLLKEELEESENRATEKEKMFSATKKDVDKFRGMAEEKDKTISRLEDELHNKEKQQLLLENQLQATKSRIEQMEENERQSATSLKDKCNKLEGQLNELTDEKRRLQKELREGQKEADRLKEDKKSLQNEVRDASRSLAESQEREAMLQQHSSSTVENIQAELMRTKQQLERDKRNLQEDLQNAKNKINVLEATIREKELHLDHFTRSTEEKTQSSIKAIEDGLEKANQAREKLRQDLKAQEQINTALKAQLQEESSARRLSEQRNEELQQEIREQKTEKGLYCSNLEEELKVARLQISDQKKQMQRLQKTEKSSITLQYQVESLEKERDKLQKDAHSLSVELEMVREHLAEKTVDNNRFKEEVASMESKLDLLNTRLREAQESSNNGLQDLFMAKNQELEGEISRLRTMLAKKEEEEIDEHRRALDGTTSVEMRQMLMEIKQRQLDMQTTLRKSPGKNSPDKNLINELYREIGRLTALSTGQHVRIRELEDEVHRLRNRILIMQRNSDRYHQRYMNPDNFVQEINSRIEKSLKMAESRNFQTPPSKDYMSPSTGNFG